MSPRRRLAFVGVGSEERNAALQEPVEGGSAATYDEFAAAVLEHRAQLEQEHGAPPEGWGWLPLTTVVLIVRTCSRLRGLATLLRFKADTDGTPLPPDEWGQLAEGTYLRVAPTTASPAPRYDPRAAPSAERRARFDERQRCELDDAQEVGSWWCEPPTAARPGRPRRCWRVGTPPPPPEEDVAEPTEAMSRAAVASVTRVMECRASIPRSHRPDQALHFDPSNGDCVLVGVDRPPDTVLTLRLPPGCDLDPDELDDVLGRVRFARRPRADGRGQEVVRCLVLDP